MNSLEPMVTAAKVGLPLLDADGMGRAFPELQVNDEYNIIIIIITNNSICTYRCFFPSSMV